MDMGKRNPSPVISMSCRDGDQSLGRLRWLKFCGQNSETEGAEQEKSSRTCRDSRVTAEC